MEVTTVHQVQALVRGRRRDLRLSQESLSRSAGVSRKWLSEFERGTTIAVELPLVLRVLAALDLAVDITTEDITTADITTDHPAVSDMPAGSDQDRELDLDDVLRAYNDPDRR